MTASSFFHSKISGFIQGQFPQYLREEESLFIEFVELYYEWMEDIKNPIGIVRSMPEMTDVDTTPDAFLKFLKNEFMHGFPSELETDTRFILKNITSFFRSRGTEESYNLLFQILFGESIEFYYPGKDILRVSDGKWSIDNHLTIKTLENVDYSKIFSIKNSKNTGKARVEYLAIVNDSGITNNNLYISGVAGTFYFDDVLIDDETGEEIATVLSDGVIEGKGRWLNSDGHLSSDKYIQDGYYRQEYSYVIKSNVDMALYQDLIDSTVHPSGTIMFGEYSQNINLDFYDELTNGIVITIGNESTEYNQSLDIWFSFSSQNTGEFYTLGGSDRSSEISVAIPGSISIYNNSKISRWGDKKAEFFGNMPLNIIGSLKMIEGKNVDFQSDLKDNTKTIIIDKQNSLRDVRIVTNVYTKTLAAISIDWPKAFNDQKLIKFYNYNINTDLISVSMSQETI